MLLPFIAQIFISPIIALDELMFDGNVDISIDTSEDILDEGISTSIYEEEKVVEEAVEPLFVFENGIYTVNTVVEGEEYVYPDNNDVRVKFTKVTEEGNLVIKRVELSNEEKELLNTSDNYGWDITSSMSNGSFKYNLTLPNISNSNDVEVKYTEDGNTYESIEEVVVNKGVIHIEGLEHFTIFVVSEVKKATYWDWANRTKQWTKQYEHPGDVQYVEGPTGDVLQKGREIGLGSDYILMTRPGTGRAYLGYDGFDSTLNDPNGPTLSETLIKEISWQSYSAQSPDDHYLNIFLAKPEYNRWGFIVGFEYATIVYIPGNRTASKWNTYSTNLSGNLYVRKNGTDTTYSSMADLISDYKDWKIRTDSSTRSGITIVSGSSGSGPAITNYIDNVKIHYTNGEVDTYIFEKSNDETQPTPTFSTTISSPTNQTSIPVDLLFNEDVYELAVDDLDLNNATISSFTKDSQSQYEINIIPEASGVVTISIPQGVVFDATGNPNVSATFTIEYDNTPPEGHISSIYYPSESMSVNSFITNDNTPILEGTCSDANIDTVKLTIEGIIGEQTLTCLDNKWSANEPTTPLSEGEHTATLTITDKAGNTFTTTQTLFIDTVPPFAIHTYYKNGIPITDTKTFVKSVSELSFTATYTDEIPSSGILKDSYVIFDSKEDGSERTNKAYCGWRNPNNTLTITTNPLEDFVLFTNCESTLADGQYYMYHQVYDNATRRDIPSITQYRDVKGLYFIVDSVAPTSEISIVGNLAETRGITGNGGWHGNGWYHDFTEVKLYIPTLSILDQNEKIQYQILNDDVACPTTLSNLTEITSGANIASVVNSLNDGVHTLCYQAKDSAGNLESPKREVLKLDRTSPIYTIDFDSINGLTNDNVIYIPENEIKVNVEVGDTLSGYTRARYDLYTADENWNCTYKSTNEDNLVRAENNTTRTLTVGNLPDGRYCLKIWVYDDVQNKAWADTNGKQWVHFVIDTNIPSAPTGLQRRALDGTTIYSCGDYAKLQTLIPDWDDTTELNFSHYEYTSFNADGSIGIQEEPLTNSEFVHSWVPTIEGTYGYTVRTVDKAGNKSPWAYGGETIDGSCKITYDSTRPTVEISNILIVDKKLSFTVSGTDNLSGARTVGTNIYNEDNANPAVISIGRLAHDIDPETLDVSYNATDIDISGLESGTYTIRASIRDYAGNIKYATSQIEIDNTPPEVLFANQEVPEILAGLPPYQIISKSEDLLDDPVCTIDEGITFPIDAESENNTFTVTCTYSDLAGNENTSEYTVTVTDVPVEFTLSATKTEITQGDDDIVLGTNITSGNFPYTYLWEGDCIGEGEAATFLGDNEPGEYKCTVTVTDADGDTATDSIDIIVGAVAGVTTGPSTSTTKPTTRTSVSTYALTTTAESEDNIQEQEQTNDESTTILGETTTETKYKISGIVFYDKNKNGIYDENEKVVEGIEVKIYDTKENLVETITTNEKGNWETTLTPGEYTIQVEGAEDKSFVLGDSDTTLDIPIEKKTQWWLIALIAGAVIILIGILVNRNKKKEENI